MTTETKPLMLFKSIPSERYQAYKDPHRSIHARNIEAIKKRHKIEKRQIEKTETERRRVEFIREKKEEKEIAAHYKLLNVI